MNGDVRREWFEKDYYHVLGVPKNASHADIKKAYRKLAQQHHPDANPGDRKAEERFKEISGAYDVLGDEEKRARYDQVREMAASGFGPVGFGPGGPGAGGAGGPRVRFEDLFDAEGFADIGDLFSIFTGRGGGGRASVRMRGADLQTEARLSFEQAMAGTTVPVRIDGPAPCPTCGGSGAEPGTSPVACPVCGGSGAVTVNQGVFQLSRPCDRCGGSGRAIEHPCRECRGTGHVSRTRTLTVKVPPGVRDGARIRLVGRGEPGGPGSPAGDLFVLVRVSPHRLFGRKGSDLTLELPVTYAEAALGATVPVPTLNGSVKLKVPAGTQSGRTFRIRGKGAPKRGGRGDLLVTVRVEVPRKVSKEEKELLERLREIESEESPRRHLGVEA